MRTDLENGSVYLDFKRGEGWQADPGYNLTADKYIWAEEVLFLNLHHNHINGSNTKHFFEHFQAI